MRGGQDGPARIAEARDDLRVDERLLLVDLLRSRAQEQLAELGARPGALQRHVVPAEQRAPEGPVAQKVEILLELHLVLRHLPERAFHVGRKLSRQNRRGLCLAYVLEPVRGHARDELVEIDWLVVA